VNFLDIGPGELILILIIALIVFGPGRIVKISRDIGKAVHAFKKASSDLTSHFTRELEMEEKDQPLGTVKKSQ
jgi:TatA/E family protein of Tat protein translocase